MADLERSIADFIENPQGDDFNRLALAAARGQFGASRPLERLWRAQRVQPDEIGSWREVPALPTLSFKNLDVGIGDPELDFMSSGTSGERSRHPNSHLDLYRRVIEASFKASFTSLRPAPDMLSLVPDRDTAPQSSLAFMVGHLITAVGSPRSGYAWGSRGLQLGPLRSWLAQSQRHGEPVIVIATTLALAEALERLAKIKLRFRLPAGSRVVHTGGSKTLERELDRERLIRLLGEHFGLGADALVGEYGMTELTSHFYGTSKNLEDPAKSESFVPPGWTRVRILDPETLDERLTGEPGLICILDLANLSSSIHVLTQDLGVADEGGGFRVVGRAEGADLRGCSLLSDELSA